MTFVLNPNLEKKIFLTDLTLCRVLMEDESHYPWLFLVPRRANISRMMDLSSLDQMQLMKELDLVQRVMWEEFHPDQLNVAAIGNKTPQLHIHVIARHMNDPAWPNTVWDHPVRSQYDADQKNIIVQRLKHVLSVKVSDESSIN